MDNAPSAPGTGADTSSLLWNELATTIRLHHPHAKDADAGLRFVLAMNNSGDSQTRIGIYVRPFTSYGEAAVELLADLGTASQVDPWEVLEFNGMLSFGALMVRDKVLMLRAVLQLRDADGQAVEDRVQLLASEAAKIKERLHTNAPTGAEFSHYGE